MSPENEQEVIIEAGRTEARYWRDVWHYRELLYFLAQRDVLVRYKQTAIGILWAVIRPLLTMLVFTLIFERVAKMKAPPGVPYPVMVLAGMLPWQFFGSAMSECGTSILSNSNLISKVYFPRLITPASAVVVSFVDFLISFVILAAMLVWYKFVPDWRVVYLPLFSLMAFSAAMGAGLWLAALNVKYRDFRYIVPFVVQFGGYVSPVGFNSEEVPEQWRTLYAMNPMVGVIDGFRWSLFSDRMPLNTESLGISMGIIAVLLVTGIWYFRKTERGFADII